MDLELSITKKYSGAYFYEEAQGISDGSGLDVQVRQLLTESLYFVELRAEHLSKNDPLFSETSSNPHDWRTDVRYNYGSIFSFLLVPLN